MTDGNAPDVFFVLTNDGRIGIGHCPDKEAGGTHIFKWLPDGMLQEAANLRGQWTVGKGGN